MSVPAPTGDAAAERAAAAAAAAPAVDASAIDAPAVAAPSVVYYGDDFTGATDTLATAARAGLRALLFLRVPDAERLARAGALDVVGIAGAARSMGVDAMHAELAPVADFFRASGARVLHYKTCSTFDSAPHIGSIGAAIAQLRDSVDQPTAMIVGGQPNLGRYCLFGQLFASAGAGGEVFRIDRHPTMSRHPVTPMHEADLRRHLALQGLGEMRLVPWTTTAQGVGAVRAAIGAAAGAAQSARIDALLFDVGTPDDLQTLGAAFWSRGRAGSWLAVGASSVVQALATQMPHRAASTLSLTPAEGPVFVLAGSLSPVTARQVAAAASFDVVYLDPDRLLGGDASERERIAGDLAALLRAGRHVLACTRRPHDAEPPAGEVDAQALARAGGALLSRVLALQPVRRIGIAGGDTSSLAVQALDAWGLSYRAEVGPGAALCRLHSDQPALDGMDVMLKGGQMGSTDVFERLVQGVTADSESAVAGTAASG